MYYIYIILKIHLKSQCSIMTNKISTEKSNNSLTKTFSDMFFSSSVDNNCELDFEGIKTLI